MRERSARLDTLLQEIGRPPSAVKCTMIAPVVCGRDTAELEQRVSRFRRVVPDTANVPLDALLGKFRTNFNAIVGTPEEVGERIHAYGAAGSEELMVQWAGMGDVAELELLAEQVVPLVG